MEADSPDETTPTPQMDMLEPAAQEGTPTPTMAVPDLSVWPSLEVTPAPTPTLAVEIGSSAAAADGDAAATPVASATTDAPPRIAQPTTKSDSEEEAKSENKVTAAKPFTWDEKKNEEATTNDSEAVAAKLSPTDKEATPEASSAATQETAEPAVPVAAAETKEAKAGKHGFWHREKKAKAAKEDKAGAPQVKIPAAPLAAEQTCETSAEPTVGNILTAEANETTASTSEDGSMGPNSVESKPGKKAVKLGFWHKEKKSKLPREETAATATGFAEPAIDSCASATETAVTTDETQPDSAAAPHVAADPTPVAIDTENTAAATEEAEPKAAKKSGKRAFWHKEKKPKDKKATETATASAELVTEAAATRVDEPLHDASPPEAAAFAAQPMPSAVDNAAATFSAEVGVCIESLSSEEGVEQQQNLEGTATTPTATTPTVSNSDTLSPAGDGKKGGGFFSSFPWRRGGGKVIGKEATDSGIETAPSGAEDEAPSAAEETDQDARGEQEVVTTVQKKRGGFLAQLFNREPPTAEQTAEKVARKVVHRAVTSAAKDAAKQTTAAQCDDEARKVVVTVAPEATSADETDGTESVVRNQEHHRRKSYRKKNYFAFGRRPHKELTGSEHAYAELSAQFPTTVGMFATCFAEVAPVQAKAQPAKTPLRANCQAYSELSTAFPSSIGMFASAGCDEDSTSEEGDVHVDRKRPAFFYGWHLPRRRKDSAGDSAYPRLSTEYPSTIVMFAGTHPPPPTPLEEETPKKSLFSGLGHLFQRKTKAATDEGHNKGSYASLSTAYPSTIGMYATHGDSCSPFSERHEQRATGQEKEIQAAAPLPEVTEVSPEEADRKDAAPAKLKKEGSGFLDRFRSKPKTAEPAPQPNFTNAHPASMATAIVTVLSENSAVCHPGALLVVRKKKATKGFLSSLFASRSAPMPVDAGPKSKSATKNDPVPPNRDAESPTEPGEATSAVVITEGANAASPEEAKPKKQSALQKLMNKRKPNKEELAIPDGEQGVSALEAQPKAQPEANDAPPQSTDRPAEAVVADMAEELQTTPTAEVQVEAEVLNPLNESVA